MVARVRDKIEADGCGGIFYRVQCGKCGRWTNAEIPARLERMILADHLARLLEQVSLRLEEDDGEGTG